MSKFGVILQNFSHHNGMSSQTNSEIIQYGKTCIEVELDSLHKLIHVIDDTFAEAVRLILNSKGRVVITGIGKSAIIAQKMVASFNSTGTPSLFLHASEAIHGDLGMVQPDDVVICISKSGNSPEIKILIPILKRFGNQLIAITGNTTSFLAKESNFILNTTVDAESCPNNLAPTNSTTAQLVMGDALAVCLMGMRNFTSEDFAKYHPGGALGKKLLLRVKDMLENSLKPMVAPDAPIKKVIFEISEKRLGVTAVVENNKVVGIITDGDVRRMLERSTDWAGIQITDMMNPSPKTIESEAFATEALAIMQAKNITQLVVMAQKKAVGFIHLHDLLKEGIV